MYSMATDLVSGECNACNALCFEDWAGLSVNKLDLSHGFCQFSLKLKI